MRTTVIFVALVAATTAGFARVADGNPPWYVFAAIMTGWAVALEAFGWLRHRRWRNLWRTWELCPGDAGYMTALDDMREFPEVAGILDRIERSPVSPSPEDVLPHMTFRRDGSLAEMSWCSGYVAFDGDNRVMWLDFNESAVVGDRLLVTS